MRILFFLSQKITDEDYTGEFTKKLVNFLKKENVVTIAHVAKKVTWNQWDLILVMDNFSLIKVKNSLKHSDLPVIFFAYKESWKSRPFVFRNLLAVFSFNMGPIDFINPEIIRYMPMPVFAMKDKWVKKKEIQGAEINILFYPDDHCNSNALPSVIQFANRNPGKIRLTILLKRPYADLVKHWINPVITIKDPCGFSDELTRGYDLVYASGYRCLTALSFGIPTAVVGPRGYGGIINLTNLEEHIKSNFQGRPGGEIGEEIPFWILYDESENFKTQHDFIEKRMKALTDSVLKLLHPDSIFARVESVLKNLHLLSVKIRSGKILSLQPKIAKGVQITRTGTEGLFYLACEGLMVGTISDQERILIERCQGTHAVKKLAKETGIDEKEVAQFVAELWYNKIIYF